MQTINIKYYLNTKKMHKSVLEYWKESDNVEKTSEVKRDIKNLATQ